MLRMIGYYAIALMGVTVACCTDRSAGEDSLPLADAETRSAEPFEARPLTHSYPHGVLPNPVVSAPSLPRTAMDEHTRPDSVPEPLASTMTAAAPIAYKPVPSAGQTPPSAPHIEDRTIPPLPENATAALPQGGGSGEAELPTADDQGEGVDLDITRAIRQTLMERKGFSTQARLLTVTTRDRVVSLRGHVMSAAESSRVIALAASTPQVQQVRSWMDVP